MKHTANGMKLALLGIVMVLGAGCLQGRSIVQNTPATEILSAGGADDHAPRLDSIVCAEGCTGYTCYFTEGTRNKKALENIQALIFGGFTVDIDSDDDSESIDRYRTYLLDSLSSLEWLDTEPWPSVHRLYWKWTKQQCDRFYIVSKAKRDPAVLYHCDETDSVLVRCADILTKGGDGYVEAVRRLLKEHERAKAARDSVVFDRSYLEHTLSQIDRALDASDSRANARERLFVLLSNHINNKIHNRLGENGTVDFYKYSDDFLRIFDSVKVETEEP